MLEPSLTAPPGLKPHPSPGGGLRRNHSALCSSSPSRRTLETQHSGALLHHGQAGVGRGLPGRRGGAGGKGGSPGGAKLMEKLEVC